MITYDKDTMARAKALYESRDLVAPRWEQLGDITKSYWCDQVLAGQSLPTKEQS